MMTWNDITDLAALTRRARALRTKAETAPCGTDAIRLAGDFLQGSNAGKIVKCGALLYIFAPMGLLGASLPKGMRSLIAGAVGCNMDFVSRAKRVILFLYNNDKMFRDDVDSTTAELTGYLKEKKLWRD